MWLNFLPCPGLAEAIRSITPATRLSPHSSPILQRSTLRLRGTMGPAWVSGRVVIQVWLYLPPNPRPSCLPEPIWDCSRGSTGKGPSCPGPRGDSLLSLPVELLAELQRGDAMLLPVLIVGLQDLVIKLLGSCNDFKMETVSAWRKEPRKVRQQASEQSPAQTSAHVPRLLPRSLHTDAPWTTQGPMGHVRHLDLYPRQWEATEWGRGVS